MASKGYQRFSMRMLKFKEDLELVDVVVRDKELLSGDEHIFANVTQDSHPSLYGRQNSPASRNLVVTHLRTTLLESFMKDLCEETHEYARYIYRSAILNGVDISIFIDTNKVFIGADEILSKATKTEIVSAVNYRVMDMLERRSPSFLLSLTTKKEWLNINKNLTTPVIQYLKARNVLVHTDGKVSVDFKKENPGIPYKKDKIDLNFSFANHVYEVVNMLIKTIDNKMIAKGYFPKSEIQPYQKR